MKRALRAAVAAGMFLAAIPFAMTVAMQANAPTASAARGAIAIEGRVTRLSRGAAA
jgi:hypothetical protein